LVLYVIFTYFFTVIQVNPLEIDVIYGVMCIKILNNNIRIAI
jgi:hypothetical protein